MRPVVVMLLVRGHIGLFFRSQMWERIPTQ